MRNNTSIGSHYSQLHLLCCFCYQPVFVGFSFCSKNSHCAYFIHTLKPEIYFPISTNSLTIWSTVHDRAIEGKMNVFISHTRVEWHAKRCQKHKGDHKRFYWSAPRNFAGCSSLIWTRDLDWSFITIEKLKLKPPLFCMSNI